VIYETCPALWLESNSADKPEGNICTLTTCQVKPSFEKAYEFLLPKIA